MRGLGQLARRSCNASGQWFQSNYSECGTFTESVLANISMVFLHVYILLAC